MPPAPPTDPSATQAIKDNALSTQARKKKAGKQSKKVKETNEKVKSKIYRCHLMPAGTSAVKKNNVGRRMDRRWSCPD